MSQCGVLPFEGIVNGSLSQPLESFLSSVDSLIAAKALTDDDQILIEAKSHLNYAKGDISYWSRSYAFKNCSTWAELKAFFRKVYGVVRGDTDMIRELASMIPLHVRNGTSFVNNNGRVNDKASEFEALLLRSDWVVGDTITVKNCVRLFALAVSVASLPTNIVACFDEKLTVDSTEADILSQVHKHKGKVPNFDLSVLDGKSKPKPEQVAFVDRSNKNQNQNQGNKQNKQYTNNSQAQQGQNSSQQSGKKKGNCFNCGKAGHFAFECRVKYCSIHKNNTHSYFECKSRSNTHSPNNSSRDQSQASSNFNRGGQQGSSYHSSYSSNRNRGAYNSNYRPQSRNYQSRGSGVYFAQTESPPPTANPQGGQYNRQDFQEGVSPINHSR